MPTIKEGLLTFTFPAGWMAEKLDSTAFYRNRFQSFAASKSVDIVAVAPRHSALWLIEVKDYRQNRRVKLGSIYDELAEKVRDSLACLVCMAVHASAANELAIAKAALQATSLRVVLHIEQSAKPSKLFPQVVDPKTARDMTRRALRVADPRALAGGRSTLAGHVSWSVN